MKGHVYINLTKEAVRFAIETHEVHQKQKRKGKDIPYITHPLTVGIILARADASEEVVVAGILHDTIEDSVADHRVTKEMVAERFGEYVAALVDSVTEPDKSLSWEERKLEAYERIKHFSHDSLLVKAADVISNVGEILEDYHKDGAGAFDRFKVSRTAWITGQVKVIEAIVSTWPESPLAGDLRTLAKQLSEVK